MAIGTATLATSNLDGMDNEQLVAQIKKSKEELFNLRFQSATDQLDNHGRLKSVRRDIARVKTVLRERELGIRTEPTTVSTTDTKKKTTTKGKEA
jgi:large subunit ribosomal protein L29